MLFVAGATSASVIQTTGAGSAVMDANAGAFFESTNSLFDNPYSEGGMLFSRVGLRNNNNGCGFAGCVFPYFSGNYFYGANEVGGFLSIATPTGNIFTALEFIAGTGFAAPVNFAWAAFLDGIQKGGGTGSVAAGTILGFADRTGFNRLDWTASDTVSTNFTSTHNAPAMDNVVAQISEIPEPSSFALAVTGLLAIGRRTRRSDCASS
jgi:hypothetical protein